MEFNEFASKLGVDPKRLTEIGKLFDKRVNTVGNWKYRNHVPAEYVVKAMQANWFQSEKKEA